MKTTQSSNKKNWLRLISAGMLLCLAACGYRGPLYMPTKPVASAVQVKKNASGMMKTTASATKNTSGVKTTASGVIAKMIESKAS